MFIVKCQHKLRQTDCEKCFFDNNSKTVEINITDKIIANGDAVL